MIFELKCHLSLEIYNDTYVDIIDFVEEEWKKTEAYKLYGHSLKVLESEEI